MRSFIPYHSKYPVHGLVRDLIQFLEDLYTAALDINAQFTNLTMVNYLINADTYWVIFFRCDLILVSLLFQLFNQAISDRAEDREHDMCWNPL